MNNWKRVCRPRVWAFALGAFILAGAAVSGGNSGSAAWQSGRRAPSPPPPSAPMHVTDENPPPPVSINVAPSSAAALTALPAARHAPARLSGSNRLDFAKCVRLNSLRAESLLRRFCATCDFL